MNDLSILYAHGFASGPQSSKGKAIAAHIESLGRRCQLLDLRVPDRERLRLSAMIERVREAIDAPRALLIGSSLGGLTAARAAEQDERIVALLLLAPAFRLCERWRTRIGDEEWQQWHDRGTMRYEDYATGGHLEVDFGFMEDAARIDVGWPNVTAPTTIVHGVHDDVVPIETSRAFADGRAPVRLIEVDSDHQLHSALPSIYGEIDRIVASLRH